MASVGSVSTRKAIYFTFTFKMILYFKIKYGLVYYFNEMMRNSFGNTYKKMPSKMNSVQWIIWNVILTIWKHPSCFADCFSGCFLSHQRVVSSNFKWFLDERRLRSWYQRWHWYWRQTRRHHVIDLIWFWFWFWCLSCVVQHIHARL